MPDLPFELIDYILTFADAASLYELTHVSRALSYRSQKHICQQHIQHVSLRLWMHQPGRMVHKPVGFDLLTTTKSNDSLDSTVEFVYTGEPLLFDPTRPLSVEGCTVTFEHHSHHPGLNQQESARKHYSITYDDEPILMNQIDTTWTMEKKNQWSMHGELDQEGNYLPLGLSCNANLFNPTLLDTLLQRQTNRLKERIQLKKQEQQQQRCGAATSTFFGNSTPLSKGSCTPKSFNVISPSSPSKHLTTSPFTSLSS